MRKYILVQDVVTRLTEAPGLKTFFTLYLMAQSDAERLAINRRFWQEVNLSNPEEILAIKAAYTACLKRLPTLAAELHEKVTASLETA